MSLYTRFTQWQQLFPNGVVPRWAQRTDIARLVQASVYAGEQLLYYPEIIPMLDEKRDWEKFCFAEEIDSVLSSEMPFARWLRKTKHCWQTVLIYHWLNKNLAQQQFCELLTELADTLINTALEWQYQRLISVLGQPQMRDGSPMRMCVLGMGKLGGGELNFSSDVDLIFAYRDDGDTQGAQKSTSHALFFRKLAQKFIALLDEVSSDGFVYRVDMRLRPFGKTGPLVVSFRQLEKYYQQHGRDWERYAMIKARPVAGDIQGGWVLLRTLRPFIYRKYLDYTVLSAIVKMKENIDEQVSTMHMENNIKLGRGGIREAEFCVQAMQMVYGGQYRQLQSSQFLSVLADLSGLKFWSEAQVDELRRAYLYLRAVENALQFDYNQQTHILPKSDIAWRRLALACRCDSVATLQSELWQSRAVIWRHFQTIFSDNWEEESEYSACFSTIDWHAGDADKLATALNKAGYGEENAQASAKYLTQFTQTLDWQSLSVQLKARIEQLLPRLLTIAIKGGFDAQALAGLLDLVREVSSQRAYIHILTDHPKLLRHLFAIARDSAWLMEFIRTHPHVLDDVLLERARVSNIHELRCDLRARLNGLEGKDWRDALYNFKHAQVFKVAWTDVHGTLPLMQVSDNLSHIAQLILETVYQTVYDKLKQKYGEPRDNMANKAEFAIIGYGKLGGLELSYDSDLDLVFLYDDKRANGMTDGGKPISNQLFFTKLAQGINHVLTMPSSNGVLYAVDMRLRPSGASGMIVNTFDAFMQYQRESAWVWERQALTRARAICGDDALQARFSATRKEILTQSPVDNLREEVLNMRQKISDNARHPPAGQFHLKLSSGGLIDIEFIVQYLLLKHAHQEKILVRMSDNIRQLAALEATGLLSSGDAMILRDTYRQLRRAVHYCFLNAQDHVVSADDWVSVREPVEQIWEKIFAVS